MQTPVTSEPKTLDQLIDEARCAMFRAQDAYNYSGLNEREATHEELVKAAATYNALLTRYTAQFRD